MEAANGTIDLEATLPILGKGPKVIARLKEQFKGDRFAEVARMLKLGKFEGDTGDALHDFFLDEIPNEAVVRWEGAIPGAEFDFPVGVYEYFGVFYVWALEYDKVGYFETEADAKAYILGNWDIVKEGDEDVEVADSETAEADADDAEDIADETPEVPQSTAPAFSLTEYPTETEKDLVAAWAQCAKWKRPNVTGMTAQGYDIARRRGALVYVKWCLECLSGLPVGEHDIVSHWHIKEGKYEDLLATSKNHWVKVDFGNDGEVSEQLERLPVVPDTVKLLTLLEVREALQSADRLIP